MADILSQSEIDDLLNGAISSDEDTAVPSPEGPKSAATGKIFSHKVYKNKRFEFTYNSPVVKQEDIVFNPVSGNGNNKDKVVVRTLDNYVAHLKNNK